MTLTTAFCAHATTLFLYPGYKKKVFVDLFYSWKLIMLYGKTLPKLISWKRLVMRYLDVK